MRIGVISNTHSGRNRKALGKIRRLLAANPAVVHREVRTPEQIAEALGELSRAGVGVIALNGGDGTIQSALTTLLGQRLFQTLPPLALLPGGTTNMTAYDICGGRRRLLPAIRKLLRLVDSNREAWPLVWRAVLRVRAQPDAEPQYGFFFGAGAIISGMEYFQARIHTKGLRNELGPGLTMLRFIYGALRGDPEFVGSVPVSVGCNGEETLREHSSLILFVSTLERFFLGMRPYWGTAGGALHFTLIRERPRHLLRALPAVLRGRPNAQVTEAEGYYSRDVDKLKLLMDGRFSLDGELHEARKSRGPVILESVEKVCFVRL